MPALLHIEEYRDGPWEELLAGLELNAFLFHRGCYTIWTGGEGVEHPVTLCRSVRQELRPIRVKLRQLRTHLRRPMRLELVCRVYTDSAAGRRASVRIPYKLARLAALLGATIDLSLQLSQSSGR